MNKSGVYIFIYASVMVIIVAAVLSFAAMQLKPLQDKNVEIEKKCDILKSVKILSTAGDAEDKYSKYITETFVLGTDGDKKNEADAFGIDLKIELKKAKENRLLPVFVCSLDNGTKRYIVPVMGKGLWGPLWGYVSLEEDYNTVYGASFAHKGETPGLGAEIETMEFQKQFEGKKIFDANGNFHSISIVKGGAAPDDPNAVDAITGGTITSNGLNKTLKDCLENYVVYFKNSQR